MLKDLTEKKEKKVEYVELIYDLIFVYIIGRNNSLLHHVTGGFVDFGTFSAYLLCTLAVIQMWNLTTYYINIYGRHSVREHVMLFVNMFLLYFIGEGTREHWQDFHTQYHVAWALILLNIGLQYLLELRGRKNEPVHRGRAIRMASVLLGEAALVLGAIFEFNALGTSYLSLAAILFGMVAVSITGRGRGAEVVDFPHLSERAMLYVVFTFGEMIIAIASYFEGAFTASNLYFSAMAFLIVVGLFLSYGVLYDHIVDREKKTSGLGYMFLHVFLIFALNNITTALEFMRNEEVDLLAKVLFLTGSFLLYYICLFALGGWAKIRCRPHPGFYLAMAGTGAAFVGLMLLFRQNMQVNIALTVVFVFAVFLLLYRFGKRTDAA